MTIYATCKNPAKDEVQTPNKYRVCEDFLGFLRHNYGSRVPAF